MLMQIKNVLTLLIIHVSCNFMGIYAAIQRDIRTDSVGACTTGLLKSLPASSFSASSVLRNDTEFGPQYVVGDSLYDVSPARKAWCPDKVVSIASTEWLQIDFGSTKIIKNIFTSGRNDGNYGEYVTNYYFDYQRENAGRWYRYRDSDHKELIKGNNDARNPTHVSFETPLIAQRIRIIPINNIPKSVCLKMIIYGCNFNDGVVEYRIPRGDSMVVGTNALSFVDDRYDGSKFSNEAFLRGGMGKLMDNIVPQNSSNQNEIQKFIVAWNKNLQKTPSITLSFRFDALRTFRSVTLYPAVVSSLGISLPLEVIVEVYEKEFDGTPNSVKVQVDVDSVINIDLRNKVASFIRMKLSFKTDWIGLNEVVFDSERSAEDAVQTQQTDSPALIPPVSAPDRPPTEMSSRLIMHVTLIACFIGAVILIVVLAVICFLWVRQRNRRRHKSKLSDYRSILLNDASYPSNMKTIATISGKNVGMYTGPVEPRLLVPNSIGTLGFRYIHPSYSSCQDYRAHASINSNEYEPIDSYWPRPPHQTPTIPKDTTTSDQLDRQSLLVPVAPDITHNTGLCNDNGIVSIYGTGSAYSSHPYDINLPVPDIIPSAALTQDTYNNVFNVHSINPLKGLLGSSMSSCELIQVPVTWLESALSRLSDISPANTILQQHLSEGEIGHIYSSVVDDCNVGIIVAALKRTKLQDEYQYAFFRQCLLTIKNDFTSHQNLLPLVGRSKTDGLCPLIIFAYPSQVNVVTFFHKLRQVPRSNDVSFTCSYVSQHSLLYLTKQLADALAFLDESSVVHRDVSARNCSIGDRFHLILSDFAIGLEDFKDDYVEFYAPQFQSLKETNPRTRTIQIPLLWMPWEAILMGNYSSMSDVWSFGVTLWEIFTECQLKPYSTTLTVTSADHSVILNNCLLIASGYSSSVLPNGRTIDQTKVTHDNYNVPSTAIGQGHITDISKHVRDIMYLCWQPNPSMRPNFQTLYSIIAELSPEGRLVDEYGTLRRLIL